jgi:hypothetical protein
MTLTGEISFLIMAILPKSSSALVTISAWAHSAQQQITPAINTSKDLIMTAFTTTQQILDRYPPLKVSQFN